VSLIVFICIGHQHFSASAIHLEIRLLTRVVTWILLPNFVILVLFQHRSLDFTQRVKKSLADSTVTSVYHCYATKSLPRNIKQKDAKDNKFCCNVNVLPL